MVHVLGGRAVGWLPTLPQAPNCGFDFVSMKHNICALWLRALCSGRPGACVRAGGQVVAELM